MPKARKISIKSVQVALNSNATEDFEKVIDSLYKLIPESEEGNDVEVSHLSGGYNNPIKYIEVDYEDPEKVGEIVNVLSERLSQEDKILLYRQFYRRLTNKSVFVFRLKKYFLPLNVFKVTDASDALSIRIKFYDEITGRSKKLDSDKIRQLLIDMGILNGI